MFFRSRVVVVGVQTARVVIEDEEEDEESEVEAVEGGDVAAEPVEENLQKNLKR